MSSDDPVVRVPRQTLQHVSALLDAMDAVTSNMRVLSERVNRFVPSAPPALRVPRLTPAPGRRLAGLRKRQTRFATLRTEWCAHGPCTAAPIGRSLTLASRPTAASAGPQERFKRLRKAERTEPR